MILDRLTKLEHFILISMTLSPNRLPHIYVWEIVHLYGVAISIILGCVSMFTLRFLREFDELDTKVDLSTTFHT